jgi:putative DNA-binding protein
LQPDLINFQRSFIAAIDRPAEGALAVYRNTVIHGVVEALRANFPVVEQIIGSEMFEHVAVDFAASCPPAVPVLALYGEEFPNWLSRQTWSAELPYLSDVAKVERLQVECILAEDSESVEPIHVRRACRDSGRTTLKLHPALMFTWTRTPAMSIWLAHQRPVASDIEPEWKSEGALFARPEPFTVHALRIGRAAHRILCGLRVGETVSASIAAAACLYPEEDCTAVFASLVNLGVFVAPSRKRN